MPQLVPTVPASEVPDDAVVLDVREDDEWVHGHIDGATHIPMGDVPPRLHEVPEADPLFVICRSPARVLVYDTTSGKMTASFAAVGDADDAFFDAGRKRLYVIGGQGFVDVFQRQDADHYASIAHVPTAPGARTGLFVPDSQRLFVAVPHRGQQGAAILMFEPRD